MDMCRVRGFVSASILGAVVGTVIGLGPAAAWASDVRSADRAPDEQAMPDPEALDLGAIRAMMGGAAQAQSSPNDGFRPWAEVSRGFEKVVSTTDGQSFYDLWVNRDTNQMLAELPRGYERQRHFFAMTVAGGELFAGLQAGDLYTYWKRYDKRLALMQPNVRVRSTGDQSSRDSVDTIFTDRMILDVPIVALGPNGQPVIDMNALLLGQAQRFFGRQATGIRSNLAEIKKAKAFPQNVEIAFEAPVGDGTLKTFHYSISLIRGTPGFRPRKADERVGFFTTSYRDMGRFSRDDVWVRYINRWHLEKAEPSLRMSPPKEPVVYYVEHTVPIRYRRWVRAGVEYWNKAFENIGIDGALEVRFQDKSTGAHMDKDPEDVRYNFIRWLANDVSTAIGPSRVNPMTGEILTGDVILTDGWLRVFNYQWNDLIPELAMEGYGPDALAWFERNPRWDPRLRLARPAEREFIVAERNRRGVVRWGGHPAAATSDASLLGQNPYDGLRGRISQVSGMCTASQGKALGLAVMRMHLEILGSLAEIERSAAAAALDDRDPKMPELSPETLELIRQQLQANPALMSMVPEEYRKLLLGEEDPEPEADEEPENGEETPEQPRPRPQPQDDGDKLDGVPEKFVGPMLAELVAHEIGHTLGLRHNFKASAAYSLEEINSEEFRGRRPWSASVMDYNPVNIKMPGFGEVQGDYAVIDIGPYDKWAIEYGYTFGNVSDVLKRVAEPELQYATDEDTWGPDPLARRYDLGSEPIQYAKNQMELVRKHRDQLIDKFVKDGQSWSRARRGYLITLSLQTQSLSMMANWIGGAHVYRDRKGDPDGRPPIDVVDADIQRDALNFVIENAFRDEAFGITPEILRHMTVDKWWDEGGFAQIFEDPTFPIHDRILGIQSSALTMLMNPFTLQRVHDNEFFVPSDEDALTLPELLESVTSAVWTELDAEPGADYTARSPMVSSLRRNLQREHLERLIDLSMSNNGFPAAEKPIRNLATMTLRGLHERMGSVLNGNNAVRIDPYTRAHLQEAELRIGKALDAQFIYNTGDIGAGGMPLILFGQDGQHPGPR